MKIIEVKGISKEFYQFIAPFAMDKKVISEFDGYPIYTSSSHLWWIAIENKKVVGFCGLAQEKKSTLFTFDYVIPEKRRNGIYKKLFKERFSWCEKNGVRHIKGDFSGCIVDYIEKQGFKKIKSFVKWHRMEKILKMEE